MAIRHQNEILLPAISTDSTAIPRYNLVGPDGSIIAENVALRLSNNISQTGTPVDKALLDEFLAASGVTAGTGTSFTLVQSGYSLFDGAPVRFRLHTASGEGATLNINATGAKPMRDMMGEPIAVGIPSGTWLTAIYSSAADAYYVSASADAYRIGDIKETMRADPGDDWLYCDGGVVDAAKYPKLHGLLPYNTEWRDLPQGREYLYVKPIATERYWMFHDIKYNHYRYKTDAYAVKKVLVFDSATWEFTEVSCPSSGATYESVSGMVYDGERFVMCVTADTNTLFYTSSDLKAWTLVYTHAWTSGYGAYDMTYDGVAYIVAFYGYVNSYDKGFIIAVNKTLSGYTSLFAASTYSNTYELHPCPGNRWMRCYNPNEAGGDSGVGWIYNGGTATEVIGQIGKWVEFFDDDTLINASGSVTVTKLSAKTKTTVDAKTLLGISYTTAYNGILYDANTDTWTLYFTATVSTSSVAYYAAHIPGTSDPTVVANYTVEEIPALPVLPSLQSNYTHEHIQFGDWYPALWAPKQKNLPVSDGDIYKFIKADRT